ncbi:MAG: HAMP domain-containing protein, partial [Acidimicrobiia bacterium]
MSLRGRLAFALALLAATSVVAVATTNYLQTSDRLHEDLDAQLQSDARPLLTEADPDGVIGAQLCFSLATNPENGLGGYAARVSAALGNSLQCIDGDGRVTGNTGKVDLPVTAAEQQRKVTRPVMATRAYRGESYRTITIPGPGGGTVRISRDLGRTNDLLASIRERSVLIGLAVIALAALGGWLIASRTARPILRLAAAAEEVATTGRLDHPVPATGRGEVGRLARAFTSMLHALDQSSAQQQRLVQDASHELRTPLTSLRTNLDTLRRHTELDP